MPTEEVMEMYKACRPLRCKYCPISFSNLDSYRHHTIKHQRKYLKHLQMQSKTYLAPIGVQCEITDNSELVENHSDSKPMVLSLKRDVRGRRCTQRYALFLGRQELQHHMQTEHSGYGFAKGAMKSLTCPRCLKDCVYRSDFATKKMYCCPYCKIYFAKEIDEDGEAINKVLTSPFECPKCNEIYRQQNKIMAKDVRVEGEKLCDKHSKSCTCPICRRKFTKPHFMKSHMRVHNKRGLAKGTSRLTCETCKKVFKKKRYLVLHTNRGSCTAPKKTPYYCDICDKHFKVHKNLAGHYRRLHTKEAVRCQYCKKSLEMFPDKMALLEHQQKVHRNKTERESRHKSLENFSKEKRLEDGDKQKQSVMTYDGKHKSGIGCDVNDRLKARDHLLQCQLCPKYFKGKDFLVEHYIRIHKVDNQWVYTKFANMTMDRLMKSKKSKKHHKSKHKEHRSPPVSRKDCLSPSLQDFLDGDEVHQCELCPARYESRKAMLQHMRRKHGLSHNATPDDPHYTGSKDLTKYYKCHLCRQTFVVEENLKQHIVQKHNRVGGQGSKFKCGYCYLAFGDRNQLSRHMISNHLDEHV